MNVAHCHHCTTVATDKTLVDTNTPFIHSPSSKTILKAPYKPIKGNTKHVTKQVRFQLPPQYHQHKHQYIAETANTTPIYKAQCGCMCGTLECLHPQS